MRVLMVSNMYPNIKNPTYGTFVKNFVDQIQECGIEVDLSVMHKHNNVIAKMIAYFYFYFKSTVKGLIKKYDCIYIHYPSYSALPFIFLNKIKKINIYVNVHGTDVIPQTNKQKEKEKNTKKTIEIAEKVIVPSCFFMELVINKYKCLEKKIVVYPSGGIDTRIFYPYSQKEKEQAREDLHLSKEKLVIGFISRLYQEKGWDLFLEAASGIINSRSEVEFVLVGSGPDEEKVKERIIELGISESIKLFSAQDQRKLAVFYNCLDLLVFPTRAKESLGLVVLEAMSCGIPVIVSDIGAPAYYIIEGENGYKINTNSVDELIDKINQYMDSSKQQKKEMAASVLLSAGKYSRKETINTVKRIFQYDS